MLPGGTDAQRIFVFNARRTDEPTGGLLVVDPRAGGGGGAITFATWDVAAMLGYPIKKFLKMRLEQLIPPPFNTIHTAKYLRVSPGAREDNSSACRTTSLLGWKGAPFGVWGLGE